MFEKLLLQAVEQDNEMGTMIPLAEPEDDLQFTAESHEEILPIIALKNTILFPGIVIPITVGRNKSIHALEKAMQGNKLIAVLAQKNDKDENPSAQDLYQIGTVAKVAKTMNMPDGTTTAFLQGIRRFQLIEMLSESPYLSGKIQNLGYYPAKNPVDFQAITTSIRETGKQIIELSPNIPNEAIVMLNNVQNNSFLLNFIASNMHLAMEMKQQILEQSDLMEKASLILKQMNVELELLKVKDRIDSKVRTEIDKQQKDYFLNQQLKTIQEELGQNPHEEDIKRLQEKAKEKLWNEKVAAIFNKEITKLSRTNPQVAEFSINLNYLELILDLPWDKVSKDNFDLQKVSKVLEEDHFGLEKVKDRILEHLAVLKLRGDMKAPILCLVGPPGVGKTSLGNSIAKALKREYVRMSLGGLHDESEIRGHRKTYIGAMPGRILQSLKKAEVGNPVFILDEIDKIGKDFRGDPSSALLEVLDPEQNSTFHDNYLDIDYDLSKVLFIATANSLNTIQPALLDRMEIIEISGYSLEEKIEIAKRHLIPQQLAEHGLKKNQVKLSEETLKNLIQQYTRESGVRSLNRQIGSLMRNVAKKIAMKESYNAAVNPDDLKGILGARTFSNDLYEEHQTAGVAIGLAWTSVGGDILFLETSLSKGTGKLTLTGNLGDVMKESATTALSFLKANSEALGIDNELFSSRDIHIHVPEGAIPKDGPSAGVTMITTLASAFLNKPVKAHLAMTGEITLRGKVLPVGGIKEKILAAKRAGIKEIILCHENQKHVEEINADYIQGLTFHYVHKMEEVLNIALRY